MKAKLPFDLWFVPDAGRVVPLIEGRSLLEDLSKPVYIFSHQGSSYISNGGCLSLEKQADGFLLDAFDGKADVSQFGSQQFLRIHGLKYPYLAGGMANGIASVDMVVAMGRAGFLGFFGSAGLTLPDIERAIIEIKAGLTRGEPFGFNIVPTVPAEDQRKVALFIKHGIKKLEVGGSLVISPPLVEYRLKGLHCTSEGQIVAPNKIFAKVSREEIAALFIAPPPERIVSQLLQEGNITEQEAVLASEIPLAEDLIAEADSGGHTDNRPALLLYPNMISFRDQMNDKFKYKHNSIRVGAAGGIATPHSVLAAFTLGADFVLAGSVHQSCIEAGTSQKAKEMLCKASMADVANAPSADMFEMGSKVQVLTKGVMFHLRANKLYEFYRAYHSIEEIPVKERADLEEKIFRASLEEVWEKTQAYFQVNDPKMLARAQKIPRIKMALIFRSYLGLSSGWAQTGDLDRKADFQIFCGPGMGAFNRWVQGSYLEKPENRRVVDVAKNLLDGALYLKRFQSLREQGVEMDMASSQVKPKPSNL